MAGYSPNECSNIQFYCNATTIAHTTPLVLKKELRKSRIELDVGVGCEMLLDEHCQLIDRAHLLETKKNDRFTVYCAVSHRTRKHMTTYPCRVMLI